MTPRQEEQSIIKEFGKEMQGKLDVHSGKGRLGFRFWNQEKLLELLETEIDELRHEVIHNDSEAIRKECADVANFAMMIWDSTNK